MISVVSAPGHGTHFEVLLPSAVAELAVASSPGAASAEKGRANAGTVLLVEDEDSLRVPVSRMLRRNGYSVLEADDGKCAAELFRANEQNIDVVLLDMTLPGMSGPEVFSAIQRIRPDVRVVFTSAYSHETLQSKLAGRQAFAFIRKPYQLNDVLKLLRQAREKLTAIASG
jgi:DNA-binding NtrC family response regulator